MKNRFIFTSLIIFLLTFGFVGGDFTYKDVSIEVIENTSSSKDGGSANRMSGNIPTSITPMAAGDSFDTAIEISIGTPFNSQLNDSNFYYQFVKFQGSAATVVDIILNLEGSDVGQDMDFDLYDEYQSYLDGSYDVAYPETISDYQLPYTGFYYIYIYQYNPEAGDSNFSISVNQKSQGIVEGEIVWENLFSKSHGDAEDMMKYLQAEGFIANDFSSFDLYSLESNSPKDYVKSASLIIYGLLRYAESAISRNPVDPASEIFLILDLCVNIFEYVDIISLPNGLLPVDLSFIPATDPDFPALGEELVLLQDNVYNLMVMNDLRWSVIRAADKYGYVVNEFDDPYQYANDLVQRANNTYNALRSTFYVNDSAPGFFSKTFVNDVTFLNQGKTNSSTVELESNALLLQVISKMRLSGINYSYALPGALLPAELDAYNVTLATHQEALYNFIVANLTVSSVPFTTIRAPGIGVESWDLVTGVKSDWSTLLGQIFLIETYRWDSYFYDTYYLNSGYLGTGISGEIIPADVDRAADLAYNTIILFYRNGLPVDRILNNETYQGDTSSIYSISQLLGVFRRLSNTYQDLFRLYGSDPVYGREWVEVGKVWLRAARDLRATVDEKLFDNTKKSYIPQYDHRANLSYRKDTVYESNSFLANAIMLEEHTLRFPFRGYLSYDDEVSVGTPSFLYLNFDDLDYDLPLIFHSKSFYLDISLKVTLTDSTGFTKEIANIPGFLIGESAYGNVLDIVYTVQNKGIYSMTFEVTLENEVVVFKTVEAKALGLIHFDTTSDTRDIVYTHQITNTYTTEFLLRDESNNQIADLNLKAFWSSTGDDSGIIDNSKYLKRGVRSSSSGKVSMSFDISTIIQDFNKNTELINNGEISFWILLNASSPESQFLEMIDPYIALPVSIVLSSLEVIVSPDIISFDQGTEDDLSISFNVKNNLGAVVGAANIGIFSGQQSLGSSTTASNGLTQITIDADDLAIFNPGFNEITIKVNHTRYPDLEFNYQVNVVPNSLRLELDSEPNFEVELSPITAFQYQQIVPQSVKPEDPNDLIFGVTGSNEQGVSMLATITLEWDSTMTQGYDLSGEVYSTAATNNQITISTKELGFGEYNLIIKGVKPGLASEDNPATLVVFIDIIQGSFVDSLMAAMFIIAGLLAGSIIGTFKNKILLYLGMLITCPNCFNYTKRRNYACHQCGNLMPGKELQSEFSLDEDKDEESKTSIAKTATSSETNITMDEEPSK